MRRSLTAAVIVFLFTVVFAGILAGYEERDVLRPLAASYVAASTIDLSTPNVVTGILITFRGFDTLGEVAVLFMVAASVGLILPAGASRSAPFEAGEIVMTGKEVLLPIILTFGAYVVLNGHLSAGGGFQGGAIIASAGMLHLLGSRHAGLDINALSLTESAAGVLYVTLGVLGLILAGGFLDPRFLPAGEFGAFLSGGAVPLISALLGIKVGAELSVIIERFRNPGGGKA